MGLFSWLFKKKNKKTESSRFSSSGSSHLNLKKSRNNQHANVADPFLYSSLHHSDINHSNDKSDENIMEDIQNAGEDLGEAGNNSSYDSDSGTDASCGSSDSSCGSSSE